MARTITWHLQINTKRRDPVPDAQRIGRPALDETGGEAALTLRLTPGVYSVVIHSATDAAGIVHLEVHLG